MSFAREDWKHFDILSGQISVIDPLADDSDVIANAVQGDWVAFAQYDDDGNLAYVAAMMQEIAERSSDGVPVATGVATVETDSLPLESGFVAVSDRFFQRRLPEDFEIPDWKLNRMLIGRHGAPTDDGKSEYRRYAESCLHLGRNGDTGMARVEELGGVGVVFEFGGDGADVTLLYNRFRDVVGLEIGKKKR